MMADAGLPLSNLDERGWLLRESLKLPGSSPGARKEGRSSAGSRKGGGSLKYTGGSFTIFFTWKRRSGKAYTLPSLNCFLPSKRKFSMNIMERLSSCILSAEGGSLSSIFKYSVFFTKSPSSTPESLSNFSMYKPTGFSSSVYLTFLRKLNCIDPYRLSKKECCWKGEFPPHSPYVHSAFSCTYLHFMIHVQILYKVICLYSSSCRFEHEGEYIAVYWVCWQVLISEVKFSLITII